MRCASRSQLAAALLAICGAAAADPRVSIALLPQVQVSGDTVLLGQVAHLRSADLALMRKLVDLPLGRAPLHGQQAVVRRGILADWMAREAGLRPADIEWRDGDSVHVRRLHTVVAGADILKEARAALQAKLEQEGGGAVRIEPGVPPRDLDVDGGEVRLQARPIHGTSLRNRTVVWVDVWSAGRFRRAIPVAMELVPPFSAVAPGPMHYVARPQAPLAASGDDRRADVMRGDWAVLRTVAGAVMLESRVEVLQDGRLGDKVRVRQGGATGILLARVTGLAALEPAP
jgi:flagella basal body P-ring formation protein FlgA